MQVPRYRAECRRQVSRVAQLFSDDYGGVFGDFLEDPLDAREHGQKKVRCGRLGCRGRDSRRGNSCACSRNDPSPRRVDQAHRGGLADDGQTFARVCRRGFGFIVGCWVVA